MVVEMVQVVILPLRVVVGLLVHYHTLPILCLLAVLSYVSPQIHQCSCYGVHICPPCTICLSCFYDFYALI